MAGSKLVIFSTTLFVAFVTSVPAPELEYSRHRQHPTGRRPPEHRPPPRISNMNGPAPLASSGAQQPLPGFTFISRDSWGAEKANDTRPLTTPVPYVVIHHTYIPGRCDTIEKCCQDMRSMQRYHTSQGWGDIGYNFCVGSEGGAYEGRGWTVEGIHAGPANKYSIGICLIGDWRTEVPPERQLATTQALIDVGVKRGIISPDYKLIGHNQTMATECPGASLYGVISTWDHFSANKFSK